MAEWLGLPLAASDHAAQVDRLIVYLHALMIIIFAGWGCLFAYMLVRFRKGRQPRADYAGAKSHASSYVEGIVALIEAVLLVGFSIPFWAAEVAALPKESEDPFEVRVVAQQFVWNVHYPGADGVFAQTSIELLDDVENPLGIDWDDPYAGDDVFSVGALRLPVDRQALIHLSTKDVIHSFALPEFRVKQDALPGMSIPVHFMPTMTSAELQEQTGDETRNFEIACAQLCGLAHYRMRGMLYVRPADEIDSWLAGKARK